MYLLHDMIVKKKGRNVGILQVEDVTLHEMWCLMKHLPSSLKKYRYCQNREKLKLKYNKSRGNILSKFNQVLMKLVMMMILIIKG